MRGKSSKFGLLGVLAISMVGCSAPAPTPSVDAQRPANSAVDLAPSIAIPERVTASEMVKGDEPEVFETQQRRRRPWVRWRRAFYGGNPYYVPYNYYYWYSRPYYEPYYSGVYWNYYDRPGFRYRSRRFRRVY